MKGSELRRAREFLGLSIAEAAEYLGQVSKRSWQYWESGDRAVKPDVIEKIEFLLERAREVIQNVKDKGKDAHEIVVIYYNTPEYSTSVLDWRLSQSLGRLLSIGFGTSLVEFDYDSFIAFCQEKGLQDRPQIRRMWADFQVKQS